MCSGRRIRSSLALPRRPCIRWMYCARPAFCPRNGSLARLLVRRNLVRRNLVRRISMKRALLLAAVFVCFVLGGTAQSLKPAARTHSAGPAAARPAQPAQPEAVAKAAATAAYAQLPLAFEVNRGQTESRVRFFSRGADYELFLTR